MKYIIVCDETPLHFIEGRHKIEAIIEDIPSNEIYIIYNIALDESNFQEIVINKCKQVSQFHFSQIDYQTRGDLETAFVGIQCFIENFGDDPIVFIGAFTYLFDNANTFLTNAKMLLNADKFDFEDSGVVVKDIDNKHNKHNKHKLRICFDLDNTLTTYPTVAGDYSTVKPIYKNITLLKKLKSDGHEIIIYTARRMKTHNGNVGKVIKDIASVTIDTLEKFNIEYDELIFGKPIADIYIDDRAINPYINDVSYFGLFYDKYNHTETEADADTEKELFVIPNKIRNNKFNKIRRCDATSVIKTGPVNILKGELFYYQNIPSGFEDYFPRLIEYTIAGDSIDLKMDYIEGIPLYYLYKNCLLTPRHIDELFDILDRLHSCEEDTTVVIDCENVKNNYVKKLKNRFNNLDYPFEDAEDVFCDIIDGVETHFAPRISPVIHGDFWFSNIILTYDNTYKLLDMKGINDDILTLNGDIYYDYGKLYQSILGYDLVLNGDNNNTHNAYIQDMKSYFLQKCCAKGLNILYLTYVTKGLVFGTLPFISHYDSDVKNNVWAFIETIQYDKV